MKSSYLRLCCVLASIALASSACSTVIKTSGKDERAGAAEREALREAAGEVAKSPWPKPSSSSLAERLAGGEADEDKVSRDDAVKVYVASLKSAPSADILLMADADRHLEAARVLKAVAEEACDSPSPRLSDVALIEDAIADLRETRAIYVASVKKLDADDDIADRIKDSFDEVLKDLGDVADQLAENAMKKNSEALAGSEARVAAGSN